MSKSDFLFLLVLTTLPIQLNKFFFLDYSYVLGIPIDYRALTVYLSDIAVGAYLIVFAAQNLKSFTKITDRLKAFIIAVAIFNFYLFTSTIFASSPEASLIFNLRIAIYSFLSIACAHTLSNKKIHKTVMRVISFSLIWQSLLILSQFALQKSVGLWIIGERSFTSQTPSIAHVSLFGQQFLRPYGTFPHPNVAGAFLAFGTILTASSHKITRIITTIAIVATFARTAAAILATAVFLTFSKTQKLLTLIILTLAAALVGPTILNSIPTASIAERLLLIQSALDIAMTKPLFGVGSNNFIVELAKLDLTSLAETRLLQPVHNVFLLILVENGIIGLLLFTPLMMIVAQNVKGTVKTALFLAILVYASIDHFLWTLPQGQLMFWLTIGYILSEQKSTQNKPGL